MPSSSCQTVTTTSVTKQRRSCTVGSKTSLCLSRATPSTSATSTANWAPPTADGDRGLKVFARWLKENPNQVVILVLEDHVSAQDAVEVIRKSGLAKRAYVWLPDKPAPTLRELIDLQENVVIMAENHGGTVRDAPWYLSAYDNILQDTPYGFRSVEGLDTLSSSAWNRGQPDAPLLLLNHWVDTGYPNPGVAKEADGDRLRARVARCAEIRGHMPNLIAVDFYSQGDLLQIVDDINGVGPGSNDEVVAAS